MQLYWSLLFLERTIKWSVFTMIADVQFLQYIQLDNTLRPEQKCMLFGNVYAKPMVDRSD